MNLDFIAVCDLHGSPADAIILVCYKFYITCPLKIPSSVCVFWFYETDSVCNFGCPGTHMVDQATLDLCLCPCAGIKAVLHHSPSCFVLSVSLTYILFPNFCEVPCCDRLLGLEAEKGKFSRRVHGLDDFPVSAFVRLRASLAERCKPFTYIHPLPG